MQEAAVLLSTPSTNGQPSNEVPALDDPRLYINRELSWLEFNRRVLEEAKDPTVPLLERLKFLAIFASNLDEFFMVRVGGLQQKVQAGINVGSGADRMPPREQLERIGQTVSQLFGEAYQCLRDELLPALEKEGIFLRGVKDLTEAAPQASRRRLSPRDLPGADAAGHRSRGIRSRTCSTSRSTWPCCCSGPGTTEKLFAVVQVPAVLPRFVHAADATRATSSPRWKRSSACTCPMLFPGMEIGHATVFRVTRNSEYEIDDDEVEDLLKTIEEEVRKRRRGLRRAAGNRGRRAAGDRATS